MQVPQIILKKSVYLNVQFNNFSNPSQINQELVHIDWFNLICSRGRP